MISRLSVSQHAKISAIVAIISLAVMALIIPTTYAAEGAVQVSIPSLDVQMGVTEFRLNGTGWDIHPWETSIGHLQGTGWFDAPGNIALGAHSWMPDRTPGLFVNLHTLSAGDEVIVNVNGEERRYNVTSVSSVSMNDLRVIYPTDHEQLTLITCDSSSFDPNSEMYYQRIIVTAQRAY